MPRFSQGNGFLQAVAGFHPADQNQGEPAGVLKILSLSEIEKPLRIHVLVDFRNLCTHSSIFRYIGMRQGIPALP